MKIFFATLAIFTSAMFTSAIDAQAAEAAFTLPPAMYVSTLDKSLFEALKKQSVFSQLDEELYGSPLRITATYSFAQTAGGQAAGLTSAILAGSTLGIVPLVTNQDLVITYSVSSHGKMLSTFSYSKNFTKATNMYSNNIFKMDAATLAWALTTTNQFVSDLSKNKELRALTEEYQYYFGAQAKP